MLTYVASTFIFTGDLPRLLTFYRDVLHLPVLYQTDQYVLLGPGNGSMLGLMAHSQIRGRTREPQRFMIDFFCNDVYGTVVQLEQIGIRFLETPAEEATSPTATFEDPDGNLLRLINYSLS